MQDLSVDELRALSFKFGQTFDQEKQDVDTYILAAKLVIQTALASADKDSGTYAEYANIALFTSYNLSAGCWPCWDESCFERSEAQISQGLESASFNIELAEKLDVGPERKKNGQWIKGAFLAATKEFAEANGHFQLCESYAKQAGDRDAELMARGWCLLMDQLSGDGFAEDALSALKLELVARGDDGEFYAGQYDPCLAYLARSAT